MSQPADDQEPVVEDSAPTDPASSEAAPPTDHPPADQPTTARQEEHPTPTTHADVHEHTPTTTPTTKPDPLVRKSHDPPSPPQRRRASIDQEAQTLVISSLRSQVQDLFSQVTALNNKLVKSYDRVSDLEDELHVTSSNLRTSSVKVSQLELERTQHLSALDTGLLVEKEQVTAELTRLMEKATDEAARRGQAESARMEIEKDLDDLSAGLFGQANTMVAEARLGRARSERKAEDAERALRETEEVVRLLQKQMQDLQGEKEFSERRMEEMSTSMGKGKYIERTPSPAPGYSLRLITSHIPYQEFLMLVAHLRALRPTSPQPPAISTLLGLPFVARLQLEDTDPTVRLDFAPALNWLTRRSVITAIQHGQLSIEPTSTHSYLESTVAAAPSSGHATIVCALCGTPIFSHQHQSDSPSRPSFTLSRTSTTWSTAIFKNPLSQTGSAPPSPPPYQSQPSQIYIFRVTVPTAPTGLPQSPSLRAPATTYPLCTSNWCLARLRTTCSLWAFVRMGVVEKIWEEDSLNALPSPPRRDVTAAIGKPPVPPRRKTKMGGLWGVASALGMDRVSSWGEDKEPGKELGKEVKRFVPPPLPRSESPVAHSVGLPPPLPPHPAPATPPRAPPPLPSRSRSRAVPPKPMTSSESENGTSERALSPSDAGTPEPALSAVGHPMPELASPQPQRVIASSSDLDPPSHEHDAFLTPSEELSLSVINSRATSPSTIPLPESFPNTPDAVAVPLPGEAEAPAAPSEVSAVEVRHPAEETKDKPKDELKDKHATLDPAPSSVQPAPVPSAMQNENAPSRTASPAPPPLPRRAAGRARPVPPPPPPRHPPVASHPVPEEATAHAIDSEQEGAIEVQSDAESKPEVPQHEAALDVQMESKSEESHSEDTPPHEANGITTVEKDVAEDTPRTSEDRASSVTSSIDKKATVNGANGINGHSHSRSSNSLGVAEDGSPFVSDATWEERTWKELVRLREEMFWARVGGLR